MGAETHFKVKVRVEKYEWQDLYAVTSNDATRLADQLGIDWVDIVHIDEFEEQEKEPLK